MQTMSLKTECDSAPAPHTRAPAVGQLAHTVIRLLILPFNTPLQLPFHAQPMMGDAGDPAMAQLHALPGGALGWCGKKEAEAHHAIIQRTESVPGDKGSTEKGLLDVRAGFLEEVALERKVGVWLLLSSLDLELQVRGRVGFDLTPRSDRWLPCSNTSRGSLWIKCKFIRFLIQLLLNSQSHFLFPHTHLHLGQPSHLNFPGIFHNCTFGIAGASSWQTPMHPSRPDFMDASSSKPSPIPLPRGTLVLLSSGPSSTPTLSPCQEGLCLGCLFPSVSLSSKKVLVMPPSAEKPSRGAQQAASLPHKAADHRG